jgi:hypothetical protein
MAEEQTYLELYNPKNSKSLTQEQLDAMENLTDEQIFQLSKKYPNLPTSNTYLILKDLNAKHQTGHLSTWQNLYNLRTKNARPNFVAWTFRDLWTGGTNNAIRAQQHPVATHPTMPTQDLTEKEIETAAGLVQEHFEAKKAIKVQEDETFPDLTEEAKKKVQQRRKTT